MSRRRNRAQAQTTQTVPGAVEAEPRQDAAAGLPDDVATTELHRRAVEIREYRMGKRQRPAGLDVPAAAVTTAGGISVTLPVMGMTCRTCEVRIAKYVGRIPNVEKVTASAVHGRVIVESSAPVSPAAIEMALNKAGYEIGRTPWLVSDPRIWATAGAGVLLVAALAVFAQAAGLGDLASGAGELSKGGLLVALMLGLAAGVSTCMALVGGLVLGLSAAFAAGRPDLGAAAAMRPAAVFVGGRIAGYAIFGAVLGAIGASITMPPQLTAVLMITVAIVMILLGARLTGLSPRVAGWSPALPMGLGNRLGLRDGSVTVYSDRRAAFLGAASFFLPCGFTQAVQIYALSTGSPLFAAALLGVFAIGTAPGLLALAGLPIVVPSRAKPTLLRLVGVVVIGFALLNGSAGIRLSGISMPSLAGIAGIAGVAAAEPSPGILGSDGIQAITTYQDANGYSPANVVVYAGYPVHWTMQSSDTNTCAASLFVPGAGVRMRLELGANTIDLPALPVGTLSYTCSMGMYGGKITVVERPADQTGAVATPAGTTPAGATPTPTAAVAAVGQTAGGSGTGQTPATASPAAPAPAVQELRTYQDEGGYGPADARIVPGIPTRWTIDSRSSATCASYVVVPSLSIELALQPGDNVIELPALKAGTLDYTCGMGMYWGSIIIESPATS